MHNIACYGLDTLYPKLNWMDKVQILDLANRTKSDYIK